VTCPMSYALSKHRRVPMNIGLQCCKIVYVMCVVIRYNVLLMIQLSKRDADILRLKRKLAIIEQQYSTLLKHCAEDDAYVLFCDISLNECFSSAALGNSQGELMRSYGGYVD
jgi:hypothetical protein